MGERNLQNEGEKFGEKAGIAQIDATVERELFDAKKMLETEKNSLDKFRADSNTKKIVAALELVSELALKNFTAEKCETKSSALA